MVIDFEKEFKKLLIQQDEPTFNDFYLQTVDIFYRYLKANYQLNEEDIQDILSDSYVKLRNWLANFNLDQNFSWYIRTIFKNNLKDFRKKRDLVWFSQIWNEFWEEENKSDFEENLEDTESFADLLEIEFSFKQIKQAISTLDEISQDIIFLRFTEEKDYNFIASACSISPESARQKCSRAIKQIRENLNKNIN